MESHRAMSNDALYHVYRTCNRVQVGEMGPSWRPNSNFPSNMAGGLHLTRSQCNGTSNIVCGGIEVSSTCLGSLT